MLTDLNLKKWRPSDTTPAKRDIIKKDPSTGKTEVTARRGDPIPDRKRTDRDGLYAVMNDGGVVSFRYDYRLNGRRETLTLGRYGPTLGREVTREIGDLDFGLSMSLAEARLLLTRARRSVEKGESPARAKAEAKNKLKDDLSVDGWATKFFEEADLADSTKAMRRSIYDRDIKKAFGRLKLEEVTPSAIMALCEKIKKERDAPATAAHVREILMQIYRFVQARGVKIENPAESIRASAIAKFKPRERALSPDEIRVFFNALDGVGTLPQIKLGLKFILLSQLRKG
jgi:hypothetical protein